MADSISTRTDREVSASIKAYFALKLAGLSPNDSRMQRLRDRILELGGLQAANSYVQINLEPVRSVPARGMPRRFRPN